MSAAIKSFALVMLVAALAGCAHKEPTLPPPVDDPRLAADIIDNYVFGGRMRLMETAAESAGADWKGPDIDHVHAWQADPIRVALFAEEPARSMLVRILDRYAEVSGRSYVLAHDRPDLMFVVQRDMERFDLVKAMFDDTDIAQRLPDPLHPDVHLSREFVTQVTERSAQASASDQPFDFRTAAFFGHGTGSASHVTTAAVYVVDMPPEPDEGSLWLNLNTDAAAALVPGLVDENLPRYRFFDPDAGPETVRAIRAYYAAGLQPGMPRREFKERIAAALAEMD